MLDKLSRAWQARRVVLLGGADDLTQLLQAHLTALGARPDRLTPDASSEALYRAMTNGRVSAVIACVPLTEENQRTLETELRETGVPLALLCPNAPAQETALLALHFGARCFEEGLPGGVYALTGGLHGEIGSEPDAFLLGSSRSDTDSNKIPPHREPQRR